MRLHDLLDGLDPADGSHVQLMTERRGDGDVEVLSVVHDSRDATPGALFCCIRGALTDGHAHAAAAVDAGAVALLVEDVLALPVPQVRVASVRRALGPVAARFHGDPSRALRVLGVTGTNGKTTTTYLLDAIARASGDRTGVIGTVGTRIGDDTLYSVRTTPEATDLQALLARMRDTRVQTVAMEVSSHALDQYRVDATHFAATCFTNLTHDHLDYHHTLDAYFDAKARLFTPAFATVAAVNVDDDHGRLLRERATVAGVEVVSYGIDDTTADVTATGLRFAADHATFALHVPDGDAHIRLPLVGPFNVANALAAAATARRGRIRVRRDPGRSGAPTVVPGRLERVDAGQPFSVLVDYAHTPDALERVLIAARTLTAPAGRRHRRLRLRWRSRHREASPHGRSRVARSRRRRPHFRQPALRSARGDRTGRARGYRGAELDRRRARSPDGDSRCAPQCGEPATWL